ncbi:hypothetical protein [Hominenteromicrobium sp.]
MSVIENVDFFNHVHYTRNAGKSLPFSCAPDAESKRSMIGRAFILGHRCGDFL